ncbi:MAG TPA: type II toxin-antitoxin system RelE/ParE family toxin [Planctomycetaceae bacterium]|nr:type II toxin-antitoxin system RelE/ParE family toxin [Planctomycetaceae bacterium]
MKFTVVWKPRAETQLAKIWTETDDRSSITKAANEIDARLRASPETFGESRSAKDRIAIVRPLSVVYQVHEQDRLVVVLSIKYFEG